jgi:hypothetical protein
MDARGIKYVWTPVGDAVHVSIPLVNLSNVILRRILQLHQFSVPPTQHVAKIQRQAGTVTLDLTTEAIQAGLLEMAIMATVILQSGRNVD